MDILKEEIILLCKDFIKVATSLYKTGYITEDEYVRMVKLKQRYIDDMERLE